VSAEFFTLFPLGSEAGRLPKSAGDVEASMQLLGIDRRRSYGEGKAKIPQRADRRCRVPGDASGSRCRLGVRASEVIGRRSSRAGQGSLYRLYNGIPADADDPGNAMLVEVDGAKRTIQVSPGTSVDVFGKKIRVKAASGGDSLFVEGGTSWFPRRRASVLRGEF